MLPQELAHEPEGCGSVPARLHEDVQDLTLVIDGSPQPEAFAPNQNRHFVEVPLRAWSRPQPTQVAGERRSELEHAPPDGLI